MLALLLACAEPEKADPDPVDADEDGYEAASEGGDDCDDARADVHPGAREVCDGATDEDCDGLVDDADPDAYVTGGTEVWSDDDRDGYGAGNPLRRCEASDGYALETGDCDDADASIHPDAAEVPYDGVDQDCEDGDLVDVDGDGYDAEIAGGDDCLDTDARVSPADADGDGVSGCAGDCDDRDPALTDQCPRDTLDGWWTLVHENEADGQCDFEVAGTVTDTTYCPACDFAFETRSILMAGSFCRSDIQATWSYRDATGSMYWYMYGYERGPFDAHVVLGTWYDLVYFGGDNIQGYYYYGAFTLY